MRTDWVLIGKKAARQGLVHDDWRWRAGDLAACESVACKNVNPHGVEVIGCDPIHARIERVPWTGSPACGRKSSFYARAAHESAPGVAGRYNSRKRTYLLQEPFL